MRTIYPWVGGKKHLLNTLQGILPPTGKCTYYEPFLGGAALFLAELPHRACVNDLNSWVISIFNCI